MNTLDSLRVGDRFLFGVEVTHKNGSKDWYDPLTADSISENDAQYLFDNGHYVYSEEKDNVTELLRYEICQKCNRTLERCECPDRVETP